MALTGQLSDMSLAELIEFFCNQRKTGRLKVDYHRGHGVFFIKNGELVDAKVGALSGPEAVYFALTLPNAAFDFSTDFEPTRRTIEDGWAQVVLEGLRRMDEGSSPSEVDVFKGEEGAEAESSLYAEQGRREIAPDAPQVERSPASAPLSMMVEGAGSGGAGKKKWMMAGAIGGVILICGVAAIPLSGRFGNNAAASNAAPAPASPGPAAANPAVNDGAADESGAAAAEATPAGDAAPAADAAADARREAREREAREARERLARERRAEEMAQRSEASLKPAVAAPTPAPAGQKVVRVSVAYDENGRVTQASVAGSSPGAEAYAGTAVRIARGRRFPAGKAGATVITIPVN